MVVDRFIDHAKKSYRHGGTSGGVSVALQIKIARNWFNSLPTSIQPINPPHYGDPK